MNPLLTILLILLGCFLIKKLHDKLFKFLLQRPIVYKAKKKNDKEQNVNIKKEARKSYYHDYDFDDNTCPNCGGLGWEYYCTNCFSKAALEPSTEKYDGDMYCPECSKNGKESNSIKEELCSFCDGTGKYSYS